jgi:hypothetical protein
MVGSSPVPMADNALLIAALYAEAHVGWIFRSHGKGRELVDAARQKLGLDQALPSPDIVSSLEVFTRHGMKGMRCGLCFEPFEVAAEPDHSPALSTISAATGSNSEDVASLMQYRMRASN